MTDFGDRLEAFRPRAIRMANSILRNTADAEDAVQDAFARAVEFQDDFAGRSELKTWLYTILTNSACNILRRRKARRYDRHIPIMDNDRIVFDYPSAEEQVLAAERWVRLNRALARLTDEYKEAILMALEDRWPEGVNYNTCKARRKRAVDRLKMWMAERPVTARRTV